MLSAIEACRERYATEIAVVARLQSSALREALALVPREAFLGPGPWDLFCPPLRRGNRFYSRTPDADPCRVYHNIGVAIDAKRLVNTQQPSMLAACIESLGLVPGERFVHIGCGTGYGTALAAAVLSNAGRIVAIDVDATIADWARRNLRDVHSVTVVEADATLYDFDRADAVLASVGFAEPPPRWLDSLNEGGRLLLPIVAGQPNEPAGSGGLLLITRRGDRFEAEPLAPITIAASRTGLAPDLNPSITDALGSGQWLFIKSVRRDDHVRTTSCCVHGRAMCLSSLEPASVAPSIDTSR